MADNDQENDEYKFVELDPLDNNAQNDVDTDYYAESKSDESTATVQHPEKTDIRRNALIAVGIILFIMVMYKLIGYLFFSETHETVVFEPTPPKINQVVAAKPVETIEPVIHQPIQKIQQMQNSINEAEQELAKKVSAIEVSQQNLRSELSTMSDQIGTINTNINNMNTQIANLNQMIGNLATQVANLAEVKTKVVSCSQPKKVAHLPHYAPPSIKYYIQAVIPGRAWLIGSNGSTITVREGTRVAGYGVVKLIDSLQGRILMSSGQVIKFSQEDS